MTNPAALPLDQRVTPHARAGHPIRVTDGNGAAVDIVALGIDAEPVAAVKSLHGESLVELPQPDILDREPVLPQQLWNGENRADPHLVRRAAGNCDTAIGAERLKTAAFGLLRFHQQRSGCAVGQLRGVPRRDEPAPLAVLPLA